MSAVIAPLPNTLYVALVAYTKGLLGSAVPVVQAFDNDVSAPNEGYVQISLVSSRPLSTNMDAYTDIGDTQTRTVTTPSKLCVQFATFGTDALRWAEILKNLWRDQYGVDALASVGAPLYASDSRLLPMHVAEQRYETRYVFEAYLQCNEQVTIAQQFADQIVVSLVEVDTDYPAED